MDNAGRFSNINMRLRDRLTPMPQPGKRLVDQNIFLTMYCGGVGVRSNNFSEVIDERVSEQLKWCENCFFAAETESGTTIPPVSTERV